MLKEAIELQQDAVNNLVHHLNNKEEITFKAPTGSGKTYMMADFMDRLLKNNHNLIFLVSTLSKSNLAKQNYDSFCFYKKNGQFNNLIPYLISSETSSEERAFIPIGYNVYLLPRDLYKDKSKLKEGALEGFLNEIIWKESKHIYLIKDECHQATNNLDSISNAYFEKIINFSATPNLKRGQNPDIEITEKDAENVKLIKSVIWEDENDTVEDSIGKFESIKQDYRNLLGVNPCLIIQISNKGKADEEWNTQVKPVLNKYPNLKWMLIVNKETDCDTNDILKAKKIPISKWKNYAKEKSSCIDIIIFKMVISEGWDIPRACMLYQIRDTKSKQLDEQVIGRVRRNPRLLDFETLNEQGQKLAMTAWVWGIVPKNKKKVYKVQLYGNHNEITNEIKIKTTILKKLSQKSGFNINTYLDNQSDKSVPSSIFNLYSKFRSADSSIKEMCYKYATTVQKWWKFMEHIDQIEKENKSFSNTIRK